MGLGLGNTLSKGGLTTPGIITDNLVLKHNYAEGGVVPVSDGAAFLDGTNAGPSIDLPASTNFITGNNVTVSLWFKIIDNDGDDIYIFQTQKGTGSSNLALTINWPGTSTDGQVTLLTWDGSSTHTYVSPSVNPNVHTSEKWHHLAATTTSSAQVLYLDGVSVATGSNTFSNSASSDIATIGAFNGGASGNFKGYICNVGIWSGVLTQAQVKSIMWKNYAGLTDSDKDAGATGSSNLVSWWNLDVETSTSGVAGGTGGVADSHGSNHGELK